MPHRDICVLAKCPEKTHARLRDKETLRRVDVCIVHAILTKNRFGDRVELTEEWGMPKVFDENGQVIQSKVHYETAEEVTQKEIAKRTVEEANARS